MKIQKILLLPLLVMVLLTSLVGFTAFSQMSQLANSFGNINSVISQEILANDIRRDLAKLERSTSNMMSEESNLEWEQLREKIKAYFTLEKNQDGFSDQRPFARLIQISNQPNVPTAAQIKQISRYPLFHPSLDLVEELKHLQDSALQTMQTVLLCMVVLSLLLAGFTSAELDRLFGQLAQSRDLNIQLQEDERRRIAQELHDGVVQDLVDVKRNYTPQKIEAVIDNLRRVCQDLKPQILEDLGIEAGLEFLIEDLKQQGITITTTLNQMTLISIPQRYRLPLFRVIQELCNNIKHHANAQGASIKIGWQNQTHQAITIEVQDDGVGFDKNKISPERMGLRGIQDRIAQMNGKLTIESSPGKGTYFCCLIPLPKEA